MPDSIFVREQLNFVTNEVYEVEYPEYLFANGTMIDIDQSTPRGAETYSYDTLTKQGAAAIIANGADDIPMVNANVKRHYGRFYEMANGYRYTIQDLEKAQYANKNLDATMLMVARESMEQEFDDIIAYGKEGFDLQGLVNYPGIGTDTAIADGNENGGTNSPLWIHKTPAQIYRDLRLPAAQMRSVSKGKYFPQAYALPQEQFDLLAETPYPNGQGEQTILSFFLSTQRISPSGVQTVFPVPKLEGAFPGNTNGLIAYTKRADRLKVMTQGGLDVLQPQREIMGWKIALRFSIGGCVVYRPLSMRFLVGF